jgi:hypothetical protein
MSTSDVVVTADAVESTITSFTALDSAGDERTMNKLAQRLGKQQPALLQYAAARREEHGDAVGEAAVFYGTLVWAMFDFHCGKNKLPRLTSENLEEAEKVLDEELEQVEGLAERPIHERLAPGLLERQPHILAKLRDLVEEDVREDAMTAETAEVIYKPTQVIVEAFDAAVAGRRPGERIGPVVREQPKVGRNEPCPCNSGKKFKKCCGAAA